tara:strand:- start:401 stop:586 length:186 start_codon:yes stop_codon:yes gene_type:complete
MSEDQQVEEILAEANAYGMREKVKEMASVIMMLAEKGAWEQKSKVVYYDFAFRLLTEKLEK